MRLKKCNKNVQNEGGEGRGQPIYFKPMLKYLRFWYRRASLIEISNGKVSHFH